MVKINTSRIPELVDDVQSLYNSQRLAGTINTAMGWCSGTSFEGTLKTPGDTINITNELSDALTQDDISKIITILYEAQLRVVQEKTLRLNERYGIDVN